MSYQRRISEGVRYNIWTIIQMVAHRENIEYEHRKSIKGINGQHKNIFK